MPGTITVGEVALAHDSGPRDSSAPRVPARAYYTGMSLALAGILMFFMALISSYIVRKADPNWQPVPLPDILWANTAILVASSITLSRALAFLRLGLAQQFARWWSVTAFLGLLFLAGQVLAWRQLADAGVFLASNPSNSFFFLLTGVHGVHLLGGVVALLYVTFRSWNRSSVTQGTAAGVTGVYWHFMDGLWVFLFLILQLGK